MRLLWQVSLYCLLACGTTMAQRGGMGGGMRGGIGVFTGGVPAGAPGTGGGFNGGVNNGFPSFNLGGNINRPGHIQAVGVRRDFDFDDRFGRGLNNGFFGAGFGGFGYGALGYGYPYYWPSYAYSSYYPGYDYPYSVSGYTGYQTSPNVALVYPAQTSAPPLSAERARPVMHEYDQNGLEIRPGGSPLYLIAFKDHSIVAATTYRLEGNTLRYTTQQNENKDASLDTVDRALTLQLNRERQVTVNLPPQ